MSDPSINTRMRDALRDANLPSLLLALAQLTGERRWVQAPFLPTRPKGLDDNDSGGFPAELQDQIRDAAFEAWQRHHAGELTPTALAPGQVAHMLAIGLGEDVPESYGPLLAEELGVRSRDVDVPRPPEGFQVVIIGAGISGICAGIKLKAAGVPFTILEKNDRVGGTWLENTYPGCGVDTPAHLYSFSFAVNVEWTRYFAKRDEVWAYLDRLARDHDLIPHIRFGTEVERADFDTTTSRWTVQVRAASGEDCSVTGNVLVPAVGMVNRPSVPALPGLDSFGGPVMHTAAWRADVELHGKRVAVIGTGASAMQLVPAIVDEAASVTIFQRSKQWAVPHPNYQRPVDPKVRTVMAGFPGYAAWYRLRAFWNFSDRLHPQVQIDPDWPHPERSVNRTNESHRIFLTNYIESELADRPDLVAACVPDYPPYGKRPLIDNGWFATLKRDDVQLVTQAVERIEPGAVVAADGTRHQVDVVLLATGFKTLQFLWPMEIRGVSGRTLAESWGQDDARAYLGLTVPDFPNMFILNGPNTNAGHGGSAIIATEFQVRYLLQAIGSLVSDEASAIEIREDAFWKYNDELDSALNRSIWAHQGMTTYYRNAAGRVVVSSPWKYLDYWARTRSFERADYDVVRVGART